MKICLPMAMTKYKLQQKKSLLSIKSKSIAVNYIEEGGSNLMMQIRREKLLGFLAGNMFFVSSSK